MSWPQGLRVVSWFLDGHLVQEYQPGTNFMATAPTYNAVQAGDVPLESLTIVGTSPILTGRHAASYVHTDDPIKQWADVVAKLLAAGAPYRTEPRLGPSIGCGGQVCFTVWGYPFLVGEIGRASCRERV